MSDPKHGQVRVWSSILNDWEWKDLPVSEAEELREATREAHAAMKDMRTLMAEVHKVMAELDKRAHTIVDETISERVDAGLTAYHDTIIKATEDAETAVFAKFDLIYDTLMGKTGRQKRQNGLDLEEAIGLEAFGDQEALRQLIAEQIAGQMKVDPVEGVTP